MTPKEKADQLLKKFFPNLHDSLELDLVGIRKKYAIKCALITVDEIIKQCRQFNSAFGKLNYEAYKCTQARSNYWLEVKKEIQKL